MEEARITITVKPIYVERIIYWVVIAALLGLLLFVYFKDSGSCDAGTQQGTSGTQVGSGAQAQAPDTPTPTPSAPKASCSDGVKNQDETDVDCGGSCATCASGKSCGSNSDCTGGTC